MREGEKEGECVHEHTKYIVGGSEGERCVHEEATYSGWTNEKGILERMRNDIECEKEALVRVLDD